MIIQMQHLDLLCVAADKETTLTKLRELGVVHLDLASAQGTDVAAAKGEESREYEELLDEWSVIKRAVEETKAEAVTKLIIECCYLTDEEKVVACKLAKAAGFDFVKTSTGFGTGGATVADVKLMRKTVGKKMGVKAAGGIRTKADAEAMIAAGATRLGCSAGVAIVA